MAEAEGAPAEPLQSLIDAAPLTALQVRVVLLCVLAFLAEGIVLNLVPLIAPSIAAALAGASGDLQRDFLIPRPSD